MNNLETEHSFIKVEVLREGHKILQNHHLRFDYVVNVKFKMEISQNFVAFSEYVSEL